MAAKISVVTPVYNGMRFLDRAVRSVLGQTLPDWELLAVDDGSQDGSAERLDWWAARDPRIRAFRHLANRGISAARNTALAAARGEWVVYLDHDDEFEPQHFERVWQWRDRGEVLVFRYRLQEERPGHPAFGTLTDYDPAARYDRMFDETIAVPLGVAHRRDLVDRVGLFDESLGLYLGQDEDGDLWRRFARAGATFTFVPHQAGIYHVRADSVARTRRPAPTELEATEPDLVSVEVRAGSRTATVRVPIADAGVLREVFEEHEYAVDPPIRFTSPPLVLDVGANAGAFAVYARLAFHPDAVVHCFEPNPAAWPHLRRNVGPFPGVTVHPLGLGRGERSADLRLHPRWSLGNSLDPELVPGPASIVKVAIRDAGQVWDELSLTKVDVLKIDTEGCEVEILESLGDRVNHCGVVLVEYHCPNDRRRIDALLPGHLLFGTRLHSARHGVVKYVRTDLVR